MDEQEDLLPDQPDLPEEAAPPPKEMPSGNQWVEEQKSKPKPQSEGNKWVEERNAKPKEMSEGNKWVEERNAKQPEKPAEEFGKFRERQLNQPQFKEGDPEPLPQIGGPLPKPVEYQRQSTPRQAAYQESQKEKRDIYQERKALHLPGRGPDPSLPAPDLPPLPNPGGGGLANAGGQADMTKTNQLLEKVIDLLTQIKDAKGGFK